jgi:hypothetical protein
MKRFTDNIITRDHTICWLDIHSAFQIKGRTSLGKVVGNVLRILSPKRKRITIRKYKKGFPGE